MAFDVIGVFYFMAFTPFLTKSSHYEEGFGLFSQTLFKYIGQEIDLFLLYKIEIFHCRTFIE